MKTTVNSKDNKNYVLRVSEVKFGKMPYEVYQVKVRERLCSRLGLDNAQIQIFVFFKLENDHFDVAFPKEFDEKVNEIIDVFEQIYNSEIGGE